MYKIVNYTLVDRMNNLCHSGDFWTQVMARTHVITLKLPPNFNYASFDQQLKMMETNIRTICDQLNEMKEQTEEWIITWPEYGLSNGTDRYITSKQKHEKLKSLMQKLTLTYKKLTIVGGTVATTREFNKKVDPVKWQLKVDGIKAAYNINKDLSKSVIGTYEEQKHILLLEKFTLVRNTAYVFSKGQCIARHDKITPFEETESLSHSIFRPGQERSQEIVISPDLAVEICLEHSEGMLAKKSLTSKPTIQLVVSNSIACNPKHCISPYVIHADILKPPLLLTDIPKADLEVIASSYDMLTGRLTPTEPTTMKSYAFRNLRESIIAGEFDLLSLPSKFYMEYLKKRLLNHQNQHILDIHDYLLFILFICNRYETMLARNFASAILSILIENASDNPQHGIFQQQLTKLVHLNDAEFVVFTNELIQIYKEIEMIKKRNEKNTDFHQKKHTIGNSI